MDAICKDIEEEYEALDAIVSKLNDVGWNTLTYGNEWTVRDQIEHVAYVDSMASLSAVNPEAFKAYAKAAMKDIDGEMKKVKKLRSLNTDNLLDWWRQQRSQLIQALLTLNPDTRLPWYGPSMSAKSFATARLMETWAHGQDVVDATGIYRTPTDRIFHIAHLGVITFGWSYTNRRMVVPDKRIRIELISPSGNHWTWGPEGVGDTIKGGAVGFCLVVTQRRHYKDTDLVVQGKTALEWMTIAQCFAGPATNTRKPGSFSK